MDDNSQDADICRVCRSEGTLDKPLFHPCICTGSIKYIHQDCLVQWLKYSDKEYCELCNHRFSFIPIYSPDMPKRLPVRDIVTGLLRSLLKAVKTWIHYSLVAIAWLGIVPLTAYRIYKFLFTGTFSSILRLPFDLLSTENLASDGFYGSCLVFFSICGFLSLLWLREQIISGRPEWLDPAPEVVPAPQVPPVSVVAAAVPVANENRNARVAVVDGELAPDAGIGLNNNVNNNNDGEEEPLLADDDDVLVVINRAQPVVPDDGDVGGRVVQEAPANIDVIANDNQAAIHDDINWNAADLDRAAEDITWARLIGLDGSLVFIEHVFWVLSMTAVIIFFFAFFPHYLGGFVVRQLGLNNFGSVSSFEGFVTTFCGYVLIGIALVFSHSMAAVFKFRKTQQFIGLCYVTVKVALLSVFEVVFSPLLFGWWLDICSLPLLGASLKDREEMFSEAPYASMFLHWLVGMVYICYFSSFINLLREVLRPGVLWFVYIRNDPNFNAVQELIHFPTPSYIRKVATMMLIFGTTVLLTIWFPVCIIKTLIPGFLPYNVAASSDYLVSEISLEFLILQLLLPAVLDHSHLRAWIKNMLRHWCTMIARLLGLESYLLGSGSGSNDSTVSTGGGGVGGAPQAGPSSLAAPSSSSPSPSEPYEKPKFFSLRIALLVLVGASSLLLGGVATFTIPVALGRRLLSTVLGPRSPIHELNTAASGLYLSLLFARGLSTLASWLPRGLGAITAQLTRAFMVLLKSLAAATLLLVALPLLMGVLLDVFIIVPVRVPFEQTPIFFLKQDWAFGVLHLKVICGLAMMFDWPLRHSLEMMYYNGIVNMNLRVIIQGISWPIIIDIGALLAIPYAIVMGFLPLLGASAHDCSISIRIIYPSVLIGVLSQLLFQFQASKFRKLVEHIKNDKYLVGKMLVNYDPHKPSTSSASVSNSTASTPILNAVE